MLILPQCPLWLFAVKDGNNRNQHISKLLQIDISRGGGGCSNHFLTGCVARGLKFLPISKDFSPSKNDWFDDFFRNFRNSGPILSFFFLRIGWFYFFLFCFCFCNFGEMGPSSKDFFWLKCDPCLRIFGAYLFGRYIPECLNIWVSPG